MIDIRKIFASSKSKNPYLTFKKKRNDVQIYAPGTQILYDVNLVSKLKADHLQLVAVYSAIMSAISNYEFEKLREQVELFLALFNAHALAEYTKLYVFLDYTYRSDKENHELIMRFRREMNEIGKGVRGFAHFWRENGINDANLAEFKKQAQKIGAVLTKRIEVEESQLYEIYDKAPSLFLKSGTASH